MNSNDLTWLIHDIILVGMIVAIILYTTIQVAVTVWEILAKTWRAK